MHACMCSTCMFLSAGSCTRAVLCALFPLCAHLFKVRTSDCFKESEREKVKDLHVAAFLYGIYNPERLTLIMHGDMAPQTFQFYWRRK